MLRPIFNQFIGFLPCEHTAYNLLLNLTIFQIYRSQTRFSPFRNVEEEEKNVKSFSP